MAKKLLLTSSGFDNPKIIEEFIKLIGKPIQEIKILYIPTAANGEESPDYVEESKKEIIGSGIMPKNLIEFDLDKNPSLKLTKEIDSIFVEGGNSFYLLDRFRKNNFESKIKKLVKSGVVYVGVSAGSIIAGPDIGIASPFDANKVGITDNTGLKLTSRIISPHYNRKGDEKIILYEQSSKQKVLRLNDGEALLIKDNIERIIK